MTDNSTYLFDYAEIPAHKWEAELKSAKDKAYSKIFLPIRWGTHEKTKGMRDFSSHSRLKLEKLLTLACDLDMTVQVVLSLDRHPETFPPWISREKDLALCPYSEGNLSPSYFSHHTPPSLLTGENKQFYSEFLKELGDLLRLYYFPDGPIEKVVFDWKHLLLDQGNIFLSAFSECLKSRFDDINQLNFVFQSAFRNFEACEASEAFLKMLKSRPWLTCYYYQQARNLFLSDGIKTFLTNFGKSPVSSLEKDGIKTPTERVVVLDDNLLNAVNTSAFFPLVFFDKTTELLTQYFRLAKYIQFNAKKEGIDVYFLNEVKKEKIETKSYLMVYSKYLSDESFQWVKEESQKGMRFIFPFGVPKYNERMDLLEWKDACVRFSSIDSANTVIKNSDKNIISFEGSIPISDELWPLFMSSM